MTAEIAIINKNAVALAADSAVTLSDPSTSKIYNTANKLFMLSKFEPVGIMIFGVAEFMSLPLETIIKMYRSHLGSKRFPRLLDYATDFFRFLESNALLFSETRQEEALRLLVSKLFWRIRLEIDEQIKAAIAKGPVSDDDARQIAKAKINDYFKNWSNVDFLPSFDSGFEDSLAKDHLQLVEQIANTVFENFVEVEPIETYARLAAFRVTRNYWPISTGLVFAGFGELDILPCVKSFVVETVVSGKLRKMETLNLSNDMNENSVSSIMPFAQGDIVYRFIQGIDPEYKNEMRKYLNALLTREYPERLREKFRTLFPGQDEKPYLDEIDEIGARIIGDFDKEWQDLEWKKYVGPVLAIVDDLPKEDLAAMAESLVNLTSLKRRISKDAETVGGPIDVAVISKGDGFIWIKRKHYFNKDLNPSYFSNYYRMHGEAIPNDN
jgi:hypothetical protein